MDKKKPVERFTTAVSKDFVGDDGVVYEKAQQKETGAKVEQSPGGTSSIDVNSLMRGSRRNDVSTF